MPQFQKDALSQFIYTNCRRQLRLNLSPDKNAFAAERAKADMPSRKPRPGLGIVARLGDEWQAKIISDLSKTFGRNTLIGTIKRETSDQIIYASQPLSQGLARAGPDIFLVESEFTVGETFQSCLGITHYRTKFGLSYSGLRTDLIQVFAPGEYEQYISPDGIVHWLPYDDQRLQLRVIEIKLTAEPSTSHFAEATYYSMALAGWLIDNGLESQYVVVPEAAVWPGSHDASCLMKQCAQAKNEDRAVTVGELKLAMEQDLEKMPFEVFAPRVRQFFEECLDYVLAKNWQDLSFHVDSRCKNCDYVGYSWYRSGEDIDPNQAHCMPSAKRSGDLCMIPYVSRGAKKALLRHDDVTDVASVAKLFPKHEAFDAHSSLRATRNIISSRAASLQTQSAFIPPQPGTSIMMPRWADLRLDLTVNFDIGSGITFALGLKGFWIEPYRDDRQRKRHYWPPATFIIDKRDLETEKRQLLKFLGEIKQIFDKAEQLHQEAQLDPPRSAKKKKQTSATVQFYIWDSIQYGHLMRIIGTHLTDILENETLAHLAWLFPPEDVVRNPRMEFRRSAITIVKEVVKQVLAAPVPHYYTLFNVARAYHDKSLPENLAKFSVHYLFEDPLSDEIPSERAHELWTKAPGWADRLGILKETVIKQLRALETVRNGLEAELRPILSQFAPPITAIKPFERASNVSIDGQLWYSFAKLNAALEELEVHQTRAMPPHEREARFKSAKLTRRVEGLEREEKLKQLHVADRQGRWVYEIHTGSEEVKFREGDYKCALAPEGQAGFLDRRLRTLTEDTPLAGTFSFEWTRMEEIAKVTIAAIDRDAKLIALDTDPWYLNCLEQLERCNITSFGNNVILDPTWKDYFTDKLLETLQAMGNPPNARTDPLVQRAIGGKWKRQRESPRSPAGNVIWSAKSVAESLRQRDLDSIKSRLEGKGIRIDPSQWNAWELALTHRLQLIWGPPGTGKSRALEAVVLGSLREHYCQRKAVRILISAFTYNALDNLLLGIYKKNGLFVPKGHVTTARLRSAHRPIDHSVPHEIDLALNRSNPSKEIEQLLERLRENRAITLVGATPMQVHNLLTVQGGSPMQQLFDHVIIDEASQMDIEQAILPIASIAQEGSLTVAGDPKQLPPIHQARPPLHLEYLVGPVFEFFSEFHHIKPAMLMQNYRSNRTIVEFAHEAGYDRSLSSYSPDLRANFVKELPVISAPDDWPSELYWTPNWSSMLDPGHPATCFVYSEAESAQWNSFEADAVAALVFLLYGRLGKVLNDRNSTQNGSGAFMQAYGPEPFWQEGVGIVTPHRAQEALIISRLQKIFSGADIDASPIRGAVDTVERFQGQQRDVMIASYSLGDEDEIRDEDEFLMSLNRFNVMVSRARAKMIVLVSQQVVGHLSADVDVLRQSRLLKVFADSFCNQSNTITLGHIEKNALKLVQGELRYRVQF